jgi:hypothetical protein
MTFAVTNTFVPKTGTTISSSEMDANFTDIENEFNDVTHSSVLKQIVPIGSVIAWLKSYPNTPSLPTGWVECNGQTLSDAGSVYNGQVIPNLNNSGGAATNRFLRGATASGGTGGSETHTHSVSLPQRPDQSGSGTAWYGAGSTPINTGSESTLPSYYEVVWIIRVK